MMSAQKKITTREDIRVLASDTMRHAIKNPPRDAKSYSIVSTSGTTGSNAIVLVYRSFHDEARRLRGAGNLLICMGAANVRLINVLLSRTIPEGRVQRVLLVDFADLKPGLSTLIADFKPDGIRGFCSYVARVAEYIDAPTAEGVHAIKFNGEKLSSYLKKFFRSHFRAARMSSIYIASEVGPIGNQDCDNLPEDHFHPDEGITIEVDDADDTGSGDLLISRIIDKTYCIERYKIGDYGKIRRMHCSCGAKLSFEVIGRTGFDYIKLVGATLLRDEFDRVTGLFPHMIDDYRAEASSVIVDGRQRGKVLLTVVIKGVLSTDAVHAQLMRQIPQELFVTPTQTLSDLITKEIFLPIEIACVRDPFPKTYKTVKLTYRDG